MGQRKGKRQLGTSRRGWEDNMKIDFYETQETGLIWLRVGGTVMGCYEHGGEGEGISWLAKELLAFQEVS